MESDKCVSTIANLPSQCCKYTHAPQIEYYMTGLYAAYLQSRTPIVI